MASGKFAREASPTTERGMGRSRGRRPQPYKMRVVSPWPRMDGSPNQALALDRFVETTGEVRLAAAEGGSRR